MAIVQVKDLIEAGVHFGHRASRWNPKMRPYIYGKRNLMPAFRPQDGPGDEVSLLEFFDANPDFPRDKMLSLSNIDRELIIRWMTRDERVVFGGRPIAAPPKGKAP